MHNVVQSIVDARDGIRWEKRSAGEDVFKIAIFFINVPYILTLYIIIIT